MKPFLGKFTVNRSAVPWRLSFANSTRKRGLRAAVVFGAFVVLTLPGVSTSMPGSLTHPTEPNGGSGPDVYPAPDAISAFVRRIFEDSRGHLWFGTNGDGVVRYDGKQLDYFSVGQGFAGVAVRGITEDKHGNIWFATDGGVSRFDGDSFTNFTAANGLPHNDTWCVQIDREHTLWVGTYGGVARLKGDRFVGLALPAAKKRDEMRGVSGPHMVRDIMEDSAGYLWFATDAGVFKRDGSKIVNMSAAYGLENNSVNCMLEDPRGHMWFATHYSGVLRFDGTTLVNVTRSEKLFGLEAWDLYLDSYGNIWFPVEHAGLYRYDGKHVTQFHHPEGLDSGGVQCTLQDRAGRLWAGGYLGLYRLDGDAFVKVGKNGPWLTTKPRN